jgi:hypothetical protein
MNGIGCCSIRFIAAFPAPEGGFDMFLRSILNFLGVATGSVSNQSLRTRDYRELADQSDLRARTYGIDPPRAGRKSYGLRYAETSRMSTAQIDALITRREAAGKECGVLYRVRSERG